jgi:hypothetical protein
MTEKWKENKCISPNQQPNSDTPMQKKIEAFELIFFILKKKIYIYKNGLNNAHPALCSTVLQIFYSITAVTP